MTDSQSVRQQAAAERRQQLLQIATERFVADGYGGTSVSAIVRQAGVAQGTFYLYFASKQALLAELRRAVFRDYAQALMAAAQGPAPADQKLVRAVVSMVEVVRSNLALEGVFRAAESAQATQRAALEGRARLAEHARAFLDASGPDTPTPPDALTAQFVITLFDNVLYESLAYGRPGSIETVLPAALRFVLRAMRVPEARIDHLLAPLGEPET